MHVYMYLCMYACMQHTHKELHLYVHTHKTSATHTYIKNQPLTCTHCCIVPEPPRWVLVVPRSEKPLSTRHNPCCTYVWIDMHVCKHILLFFSLLIDILCACVRSFGVIVCMLVCMHDTMNTDSQFMSGTHSVSLTHISQHSSNLGIFQVQFFFLSLWPIGVELKEDVYLALCALAFVCALRFLFFLKMRSCKQASQTLMISKATHDGSELPKSYNWSTDD